MPYGTVGPGLISAASSTYQTFLGLQSLQFEGKTNGTKKKKKKPRHCSAARSPPRHDRNYQRTPTTRWLEVMQMQLASICIRQQLTDAQMAARQRCARHLWQRGEDWRPFCLKLCPSGWRHHRVVCDAGSRWGSCGGRTAPLAARRSQGQTYTVEHSKPCRQRRCTV